MRKKPKIVEVHDHMQKGYRYVLMEPTGRNYSPDFKPDLTPEEMLKLGVFGGKYMTDCRKEFPSSWFTHARLSSTKYDAGLNYYKVRASQSFAIWKKNGWIYHEDPRGWFQWYCRYYMGRRIPIEDARQINRWRAIERHISQLQKNCAPKDNFCRPRQRQAILHWAYDSRKL